MKKKNNKFKQNNAVLKRLGALGVNDEVLQEKYDILLEEYKRVDLKFKVVSRQIRGLKEKHKKQLNESYQKCEKLKTRNVKLSKSIRRLKDELGKSGKKKQKEEMVNYLANNKMIDEALHSKVSLNEIKRRRKFLGA